MPRPSKPARLCPRPHCQLVAEPDCTLAQGRRASALPPPPRRTRVVPRSPASRLFLPGCGGGASPSHPPGSVASERVALLHPVVPERPQLPVLRHVHFCTARQAAHGCPGCPGPRRALRPAPGLGFPIWLLRGWAGRCVRTPLPSGQALAAPQPGMGVGTPSRLEVWEIQKGGQPTGRGLRGAGAGQVPPGGQSPGKPGWGQTGPGQLGVLGAEVPSLCPGVLIQSV